MSSRAGAGRCGVEGCGAAAAQHVGTLLPHRSPSSCKTTRWQCEQSQGSAGIDASAATPGPPHAPPATFSQRAVSVAQTTPGCHVGRAEGCCRACCPTSSSSSASARQQAVQLACPRWAGALHRQRLRPSGEGGAACRPAGAWMCRCSSRSMTAASMRALVCCCRPMWRSSVSPVRFAGLSALVGAAWLSEMRPECAGAPCELQLAGAKASMSNWPSTSVPTNPLLR